MSKKKEKKSSNASSIASATESFNNIEKPRSKTKRFLRHSVDGVSKIAPKRKKTVKKK